MEIPYDLAYYGEVRLRKLDLSVLREECHNRGIRPRDRTIEAHIRELLRWKSDRKGDSRRADLKSARSMAIKAVALDNSETAEDAAILYDKAAKILIRLVAQEKKDSGRTNVFRVRAEQYFARASRLRSLASRLPRDLKGWGRKKLSKLDPTTIRRECELRNIAVACHDTVGTFVEKLLEWKIELIRHGDAEDAKDKDIRKISEEFERLKVEHATLKRQNQALAREMKDLERLYKKSNDYVTNTIRTSVTKMPCDDDGFISKAKYRKYLQRIGLDLSGQDVFHIIACSNGGPDHKDNYLFALGKSFNRSIGDRHDALNCRLAGLDKTRMAVKCCHLAERLKRGVDKRGKSRPAYYSEGRHRGKTAERLFKEGGDYMRDIRAHSRAAAAEGRRLYRETMSAE